MPETIKQSATAGQQYGIVTLRVPQRFRYREHGPRWFHGCVFPSATDDKWWIVASLYGKAAHHETDSPSGDMEDLLPDLTEIEWIDHDYRWSKERMAFAAYSSAKRDFSNS